MATFHELDGALEVRHRHEIIRIAAWGKDSARVRIAQHRLPLESAGPSTSMRRRAPKPSSLSVRIQQASQWANLK